MFVPRVLYDNVCAGSPLLFEERGGGLIQCEFFRTPHLHPLPLSKRRGDSCMTSSQHACFLKAEIPRSSLRWRADDDMVEQLDLQKLGGFSQTSRQAVVSLARRWVAGRMVVHDNHGMGRISERRAKNFTRMSNALIEAAERNRFNALQPVTRVQQNNAKRLSLEHPHFLAE